jgi:hypothetical protein
MAIGTEHLEVYLNFLGPEANQQSCKLYYTALSGGPVAANATAIADVFFAKFDGLFAAVLSDDVFFLNVKVVWQGTLDQFEGFSTDNSTAGTADQPYMGEEIAVVIQRRTNIRGRNKRGRIFVPFVPVSFCVRSTLTTAALTKYKAIADAMETNTVSGSVTFVPGTPDFKGSVIEDVKQCRVVTEIMSRRDRRNPKRPAVFG